MAGKGNTVSRVTEIITPYAHQLGLEIWDVRFAKEGTDWYLRIFIDKDGGISIDDCVDLTHAITKPLDEADPISQSYTLEVSSPGVERELTADAHFEKYIGSNVMVRLIRLLITSGILPESLRLILTVKLRLNLRTAKNLK